MRQNDKSHWDKVYSRNSDQEVGWYQEIPAISLQLIEKHSISKSCAVVDIGGGNSNLCKELFNKGFQDLTVLELSSIGLDRSKSKFNKIPGKITFIEGNVLSVTFSKQFSVWHDRAVYHFLWDETEINAYIKQASNYIKQNGFLILGAFAENGPELCSGLPVNRQSIEKICNHFEPAFRMMESFKETHITPSGKTQEFLYTVLRRN